MAIVFEVLTESYIEGLVTGTKRYTGSAFGLGLEFGVCAGAFAYDGDALMFQEDGDTEPEIPPEADGGYGYSTLVTGYNYSPGTTLGAYRYGGASFGIDMFGAGGGDVGYRVAAFEAPPMVAYGFFTEPNPIMVAYGGVVFERIVDLFSVHQGIDGLPTAVLRERARLASTGRASLDALIELAEAIALDSRTAFVLFALAEDEVVLSSPAVYDYTALARVVDRMLASGTATSYLEALQLVAEAIVLRSMAGPLLFEQVLDTAVITALVADAFTAAAQVIERLLAGDVALSSHHMTAVVRETVLADASVATTAELAQLVRESVGFAVHLALDTGEYVAWVLNTEGKGVSTYQNYPFNSFMKLGGKYYGAMSDGLYLLEGEDDAGTDIAARIRLGVTDMNTRKLKRVPEAYIGYKSDGNLLLRVIVTDDHSGDKVALEYLMRPRPAVALRESRFEPGRGVNVVDWDFEIENINGADFDLAEVEFHPLITTRRTRG